MSTGEHEAFGETPRDLQIGLAASDPDLVAFYELKVQGFTEAVSDNRADALEEMPVQTLRAEIQRDYGLDEAGLREAETICFKGIGKRKHRRNLT